MTLRLPNRTMSAVFDNEPWIGLVVDISDEHGDNSIKFMHPHGPAKLFHWSRDEDLCWLDKKSILCVINTPSLKMTDLDSLGNYLSNDTTFIKIGQPVTEISGPKNRRSRQFLAKFENSKAYISGTTGPIELI